MSYSMTMTATVTLRDGFTVDVAPFTSPDYAATIMRVTQELTRDEAILLGHTVFAPGHVTSVTFGVKFQ